MPATALQHFQQDIARANAIVRLADPLPQSSGAERLLRSDLLRSAWMFAVGALDAYFCDAYTDLIAATISSKSRQPAITLPDSFYEIRFPVRAILEEYVNPNWRWRMAAREMMERENVLSLTTIQKLFNKFFPKGRKLFGDLMHEWISHPTADRRLFGLSALAYAAMSAPQQNQARQNALEQFENRYEELFQRRHDCIHNCDRPKVAPQLLRSGTVVAKVIQDVEFLVARCDAHIDTEFREFLVRIGCSAKTITNAGY